MMSSNKSHIYRQGGMIKHSVVNLYHESPEDIPLEFWCYGLEFIALV